MRAGGCTLQQTLTSEAASVLKHSLSLARRRGHAQVTPLHVAATLLSSRASLLRRACLKSQPHYQTTTSHPLQCRALELCFNVALNRLPTTPPGPLLHAQPSLSNALIAALKRAQAHQRRGCIEQQQQQPLLTNIKVELEQLIISILDDPSVSRVMREAGFSSTAVKNNLEDSTAASVFHYCYSSSSIGGGGGVFSSPASPSSTDQLTHRDVINPVPTTFSWQTTPLFLNNYSSEEQNPFLLISPQKKHPSTTTTTTTADSANSVKVVVEVLLRNNKRRNTVIVGDSVSSTEGIVSELMGRVERGEVPEELKSAHFIKFQFAPVSLRFMKRQDVEMNLSDLKRKVDSLIASGGGGAIIYAGDLKWTVEATVSEREGGLSKASDGDHVSGYSPVDHLVAGIGRLLFDYSSSNAKVWLMATASYQTHIKCQLKQPPLEIQWALQAVSVPLGGLGLTLNASSVHDSKISFPQNQSQPLETKPITTGEEQDKLTCCAECTSNYEKEAGLFKSGQQKLLPSWLQPHGPDTRQKDELVELRRNWNRVCHNIHYGRPTQNQLSSSLYNNQSLIGNTYSYTSSYPWWPTHNNILPDPNSISFADSALKPSHSSNLMPRFRRQQSCSTIEFSFSNESHKHQTTEPRLDPFKNIEDNEVKITLALGNSVFSDPGKSPAQKRERAMHWEDICEFLQENVPWQSETIPSIVEALIDSKSSNKETWLLIQGNDLIGKRRLARAIAEAVFGSADLLFHVNMRTSDNGVNPCSEILARASKNHGKLVFLVEDVDFADSQFMKFLADGFETGKLGDSSNRREGTVGSAIFILCARGGDSTSIEDRQMNHNSLIQMKMLVNGTSPSLGTPNLDHKRKAEWDLSKKSKNSRVDEKEDGFSATVESGNSKKDFSRQSSFNTSLDLNIKADEHDDSENKPGEYSPISSDLTRDTGTHLQNPHGSFLESIKNRFVLDRDLARDSRMMGEFLSKIKESVEEVCGSENMDCFTVENRLLEEMLLNSASFLNSLFEKWLKDVLQTSFQTVKTSGKEGMGIKLCFGGHGDGVLMDGFMGSSLPRKIQVSFVEY
ncbi:hypothetical protein L1049_000341 [Liquidambar formosana]|uniref:Clp R domain-containing protein n=1 Tax=Liquidambar formosana TaxID=63359 RepID=A0AAP0R2N2_LIQFO